MPAPSRISTSNLFVVLLAFYAILFICVVICYVSNYFLFKKMGKEGWEGIIPFYNEYVLFKELWDTNFFWLYLVMGFLAVLPGIIIMNILLKKRLADAFGKDNAFVVGLVLLHPIFICILAFDSSEYLNYTEEATTDDYYYGHRHHSPTAKTDRRAWDSDEYYRDR